MDAWSCSGVSESLYCREAAASRARQRSWAGVRWPDIPSLCFGIRGDEGYCHFPMPFWKRARIWMENRGAEPAGRIGYAVAWRPEAPARFCNMIRCGIQHGGVNETYGRYASLAFWYARDRAGLAQSDTIVFSGPGVQTLTNYFEGDDDKAAVTCAIFKTGEPVTRTLVIDPSNAGPRGLDGEGSGCRRKRSHRRGQGDSSIQSPGIPRFCS